MYIYIYIYNSLCRNVLTVLTDEGSNGAGFSIVINLLETVFVIGCSDIDINVRAG